MFSFSLGRYDSATSSVASSLHASTDARELAQEIAVLKEEDAALMYNKELFDKINAMNSQLKDYIRTIEDKHVCRIDALENKNADTITSLKNQHACEITDSDNKHASEITDLNSEYALHITSLDDDHASEITELKIQHALHINSLETEVQGVQRQLAHQKQLVIEWKKETYSLRIQNFRLNDHNEEVKRQARLLYTDCQKKQAENAASISILKNEHQGDIDSFRIVIAMQKTSHQSEIQTLKSTHEAAIKTMKSTDQGDIDSFHVEIAMQSASRKAALALQQNAHQFEHDKLAAAHQAKIETLQSTHQSRVSELHEAHEIELEAVTEGYFDGKEEAVQFLHRRIIKLESDPTPAELTPTELAPAEPTPSELTPKSDLEAKVQSSLMRSSLLTRNSVLERKSGLKAE